LLVVFGMFVCGVDKVWPILAE